MLFHGQPHRIDPMLAHAYNCIVDLFRFCFHITAVVARLEKLWPDRYHIKFSLVLKKFDDACRLFGLKVIVTDLRLLFGLLHLLRVESVPHKLLQLGCNIWPDSLSMNKAIPPPGRTFSNPRDCWISMPLCSSCVSLLANPPKNPLPGYIVNLSWWDVL